MASDRQNWFALVVYMTSVHSDGMKSAEMAANRFVTNSFSCRHHRVDGFKPWCFFPDPLISEVGWNVSGITPVPKAAEPLLQHVLAYRCVPAGALQQLKQSVRWFCCKKKGEILLKCSFLECECDCLDVLRTHTSTPLIYRKSSVFPEEAVCKYTVITYYSPQLSRFTIFNNNANFKPFNIPNLV